MAIQEISKRYDHGKSLDGYDVLCRWFIKDEVKEAWFDQEALAKDDGETDSDFGIA